MSDAANASTPAEVMDKATLEERLTALTRAREDRWIPARNAVTPEGIRQIADFAGDLNPVYLDPAFAARSIHGGLVAPPTSVLFWHTRGFEPARSDLWVDAKGERRFRLDPQPARLRQGPKPEALGALAELFELMPKGGFTSVVVTDWEATIHRYPRAGDRLSYSTTVLLSFKGPKQTGLGIGYFLTTAQGARDQEGRAIYDSKMTLFQFAPSHATP
jgi:acyl dehydratase